MTNADNTLSLLNTAAAVKHNDQERGYIVDSTIVRIMKARNIVSHTDLIAETVADIKTFTAEAKLIKQRISMLLERDFIERKADEPNFYVYIP
jgi:cullin 1